MSDHETIRPASEIEWLLIEPHVTRWMEAQKKMQTAVAALAPEPGAMLDLDSKAWQRKPAPEAAEVPDGKDG